MAVFPRKMRRFSPSPPGSPAYEYAKAKKEALPPPPIQPDTKLGTHPTPPIQTSTSSKIPFVWSGKIEEFSPQGTKQSETFFVEGKRTGGIKYPQKEVYRDESMVVQDVTPVADISTPSRLKFALQEQRTATTQDFILGDEGISILEQTTISMPTIFPEEKPVPRAPIIGDPIKAIKSDTYGEVFTKLFPRAETALRQAPIIGGLFSFVEKKAAERAQTSQSHEFYQLTGKEIPVDIAIKQQRIYAGRLLQVGLFSYGAVPRAVVPTFGTEITRVKLSGVTQQANKKIVNTEAAFIASQGTKSVSGIIKSTTKIQALPVKIVDVQRGLSVASKINTASTTSVGTLTGRGITLSPMGFSPINKVVVFAKGKPFVTAEIARIWQKGKLTFSKTLGSGIKQPGDDLFRSGSVSTIKGNKVLSLGATKASGGDVFSAGILKIRRGSLKDTFRVIDAGSGLKANLNQIITPTIKQIGLQQTISSVSSFVKFPKPIISKTFSTSIPSIAAKTISEPSTTSQYAGMGLYERTTGGLTPALLTTIGNFGQTTSAESLSSFTTQKSFLVLKDTQISANLLKQKKRQRQEEMQRQIISPIQTTIVRQMPKQLSKQRQALLQRRVLIQKQIFPYIPINIFPRIHQKTPKRFFKFPGPVRTKKGRDAFPVFVRRFGKWKLFDYGKSPMEALLKGKEYSQTTLGRSFYVGGIQPSNIYGFRTKIEKGKQIFIEKPKYLGGGTLGTASELREIFGYRKKKR